MSEDRVQRPYMSYGLSQFDSKMVDSWNDPVDLRLIAEELAHRARASARSLRSRTVARIVELDAEPPALPEASGSRPPDMIEALNKRIVELEEEVAQLKHELKPESLALSALHVPERSNTDMIGNSAASTSSDLARKYILNYRTGGTNGVNELQEARGCAIRRWTGYSPSTILVVQAAHKTR